MAGVDLRAFTVHQPWARLIAIGEKLVENRDWHTNHRGIIAIHSSRSDACIRPKYDPRTKRWIDPRTMLLTDDMPHGVIVGLCEIIDTVQHRAMPSHPVWWRLQEHAYATGSVCWILARPFVLPKPIAVRGQQGIWKVPADVAAQVLCQVQGKSPHYLSAFTRGGEAATCGACGQVSDLATDRKEYLCQYCDRTQHDSTLHGVFDAYLPSTFWKVA
jgi:hypothetical protein